MQATGIPEHYKIAEEVNILKERINEMENERKRDHSTILGTFEELPSKLSRHILDNFQVNGVTPITQTYLHETMNAFSRNLLNDILPRLERRDEMQIPENAITDTNNPESVFQYFHWGGRMMRIFPQNFHLSNLPVKMIWNLWHFGNGAMRIYPYKLIKERKQFFDLQSKSDKELYSKASKVVGYVEEIARMLQIIPNDQNVSQMSKIESDTIFDKVYLEVVDMLYPDGDYNCRIYDLTYTALYNRICKKQS
jgi:hypothetical protein